MAKMRRTRRTYRRKRIFRKKRIYKRYRGPKPDGAIYAKIHGEFPMLNDAATGYASINVNWAGNGTAPVGTDTARLTVMPEFTNMVADYNEYKVQGLKIKIMPIA